MIKKSQLISAFLGALLSLICILAMFITLVAVLNILRDNSFQKNHDRAKMVIEDSVVLVDEFSNDIHSEDFTFDDGVIYRNELEFLLANYFLEIKDSKIITKNYYSIFGDLFGGDIINVNLFGGLNVAKGLRIRDSTLYLE